MADKEEAGGENTRRGNDWEVVSLTASAYAAAPGPKEVNLKDDYKEAETSHPLYMSRHFVFPPSELTEICEGKASQNIGFEQETGFHGKEEEGELSLKGLGLSDELAGLEKGKRGENIFKAAMRSLHDERAICGGGSHVYEQKEPIHEPTEPVALCVVPDEKHQVANVLPPCEAWWKRRAASLRSQAKETNTVWSIFIAAAVMGIVIIGQHWQRERVADFAA